jgi:alpha-D-ribose 1-methylphosphonate 5-triphosphate diphosphatase
MERRLAAAGVTTEFHAISFQDQLRKSRSLQNAEERAAALIAFNDSPERPVRHHILHRLDVRTPDSLASALRTLRQASVPYVSLNDHTPGQGQYRDVERLIERARETHAMRGGEPVDPEWYRKRMRDAMVDHETVPAFYESIATARHSLPLVISTHDDDTVAKVEEQRVLGATIAEFPITVEAARHARQHGMSIIIGAPNIVRGGSQSGNLSAADLVRLDLADIICADYHAPSIIPAAFRLVQEGLVDLPTAIGMITRAPAEAVGLSDRGAILPGLLADIVLVHLDEAGWPHVIQTFGSGRESFSFRIGGTHHPESSDNGAPPRDPTHSPQSRSAVPPVPLDTTAIGVPH